MREYESLMNTLLWNANQSHRTAAYRDLMGMDDPARNLKYAGLGCYTGWQNLSESERAVYRWISKEADKIKYGLAVTARLRGCSKEHGIKLEALYQQGCEALVRAGVTTEISPSQAKCDAAFSSCGGHVLAG